jgi:hypothetical protein
MATDLRFDEVLRVLTRNEVRFVVVGGVAAILQGSPIPRAGKSIPTLPGWPP